MQSGIYAILNTLNDKIYIGSAVRIQYRWKNHRIALQYNKHSNRYLQSAYNEHIYSTNPFIFTILEYCEVDKLIEREQYYIDLLKSSNREFGYNLSPNAGSCIGVKHSEQTLELWSKQRKGKKRSDEAKASIKAGWKQRRERGPVSEETRRKLSESHKGYKHPEEVKIKMGQSRQNNSNAKGSVRSQAHIDALTNGRRKAAKRKEKELLWIW